MSPLSRPVAVLAAAVISLALAGCGPKGEGAGTTSTDDAIDGSMTTSEAAGGSGDSASAGSCPTEAEGGYDLFSSDQVVAAPENGATFGDGTPISWTFTGPVEGTPDVDIWYVNDAGESLFATAIFLDDLGNNSWGSDRNVFDSNADGRQGFMILALTHGADASADGTLEGTREVVGIYCVGLKVAP